MSNTAVSCLSYRQVPPPTETTGLAKNVKCFVWLEQAEKGPQLSTKQVMLMHCFAVKPSRLSPEPLNAESHVNLNGGAVCSGNVRLKIRNCSVLSADTAQ